MPYFIANLGMFGGRFGEVVISYMRRGSVRLLRFLDCARNDPSTRLRAGSTRGGLDSGFRRNDAQPTTTRESMRIPGGVLAGWENKVVG